MLSEKTSLFFLLLITSLCLACGRQAQEDGAASSTTPTKTHMKAVIQQQLFYEAIPSASGLEVHHGLYYVIGDDSPFLYVLDKALEQVNRIALTDITGFESGRVSKDTKQDLEAMTKVTLDGQAHLLLLGSGASAARQQAYLVSLQDPQVPVVQQYSLEKLYQRLQQDDRIFQGDLLNIEGAAVGNGKLYLLQRALGAGKNVLITFDLEQFISYLKGSDADDPAYSLAFFRLPLVADFSGGFSGAYFFDNKLFFTASVESTTDAIADGEVLGSFIGFIPAAAMEAAAEPKSGPLELAAALITRADGSVYKGKVESLVVVEAGGGGDAYTVLAVTDDDQGGSELLELRLVVGEKQQ